QKAALYNPKGVGGTHVMYVLQHGDRPGLYNNLPTDPTISPWVSLWKGIAKPLMALALGVAALGAFFHYVTRGPKDVDESADSGGRTATRHDREV
ncbi:MAG: formate dehydrogenase N subunit beta transmembrane domain-containing protein, partial [Burkholderiaceae bacterium]